MNSREFARQWLEREGLFDKDSDYDGWLGTRIMEVIEFIAKQGHSGGSMFRLLDILNRIYTDYDNNDSPLWQAYWQSDEGKRLLASVNGSEVA